MYYAFSDMEAHNWQKIATVVRFLMLQLEIGRMLFITKVIQHKMQRNDIRFVILGIVSSKVWCSLTNKHLNRKISRLILTLTLQLPQNN